MAKSPKERLSDDEDSGAEGSKLVRPDAMEKELIEFVAAVDDSRRRLGKSQLSPAEFLQVAKALGYRGPRGVGIKALEQALANYRQSQKRLFPSCSEIHGLLLDLGFRRSVA
jgi:hypothetical protein